MPADTTETVAEHNARLQPSINLHAPVTATSSSVPNAIHNITCPSLYVRMPLILTRNISVTLDFLTFFKTNSSP